MRQITESERMQVHEELRRWKREARYLPLVLISVFALPVLLTVDFAHISWLRMGVSIGAMVILYGSVAWISGAWAVSDLQQDLERGIVTTHRGKVLEAGPPPIRYPFAVKSLVHVEGQDVFGSRTMSFDTLEIGQQISIAYLPSSRYVLAVTPEMAGPAHEEGEDGMRLLKRKLFDEEVALLRGRMTERYVLAIAGAIAMALFAMTDVRAGLGAIYFYWYAMSTRKKYKAVLSRGIASLKTVRIYDRMCLPLPVTRRCRLHVEGHSLPVTKAELAEYEGVDSLEVSWIPDLNLVLSFRKRNESQESSG